MVGLARPTDMVQLAVPCLEGDHLPGGSSWHIKVVITSSVPWNGRSLNQN